MTNLKVINRFEKYAPLIVFAYNRANHLAATLTKLKENYGANETTLFIFIDAPNPLKIDDIEKHKAVIEVIRESGCEQCFKQVIMRCAEEHKGLASSVIENVSQIIKEFGSVIVVEDDLVTSKSFLYYMNEALMYFEKDFSIWSISGYSEKLKSLKNYCHDVYLLPRASSWGWATWENRWNSVDWDIENYESLLASKGIYKRFVSGGKDSLGILKRQLEGKSDSWAIRWTYAQAVQGKMTIFPKKTYVFNIGLDGSGTHCGATRNGEKYVEKDMEGRCTVLENVHPNKRIIKEYYFMHTDSLDKKIKRNFSIRGIKKFIAKILK